MLWRGPLSGCMRQWVDDCSIGIFLNSKDGFPRSCSSREGAFYAISIGVAFINPYLCLAFHAVLAIYYAFDPISRRVALEGNP